MNRKQFVDKVNSYLGTYEVTNWELVKLFFENARNTWITKETNFSVRFAWCAAFVYHCLRDVGIYIPMEAQHTIRAKSYLPKSMGGQLDIYAIPLEDAREGDILVTKRGKNSYHVTTINQVDNLGVLGKGGNQNNRVKISRYGFDKIVAVVSLDDIIKKYSKCVNCGK